MASFCPKCGSALSANQQSCPSCGVAAATGGAAPASSGSSAVKIILIIVVIIVGLGILGLGAIGYVGYRVSRAVHINHSGDQMTLQTPDGKINLNTSETFTAAELGTDIYPGAQSTSGGARLDLPDGTMVTGVFLTSDPEKQVADFYKGKLGSGAVVLESSEGAVISTNMGPKEAVVVTISANSAEDKGKTRVTIMHTKNTKTP
ncbi:MAG: zinc ribbon domain-containing protein [Terracidiphilus sp.]|jgi:hypothetical protein